MILGPALEYSVLQDPISFDWYNFQTINILKIKTDISLKVCVCVYICRYMSVREYVCERDLSLKIMIYLFYQCDTHFECNL